MNWISKLKCKLIVWLASKYVKVVDCNKKLIVITVPGEDPEEVEAIVTDIDIIDFKTLNAVGVVVMARQQWEAFGSEDLKRMGFKRIRPEGLL